MNRKNLNGSFNITVNGMPYNTIQGDKYYNETLQLFNSNPELFELETKIEIPLEELKQEKLNILNSETQKFIYAKYPIYKQLNIINPLNDYTDKDRNTMNEFINEVRSKNHKFIEQINNCISKEELELININFE